MIYDLCQATLCSVAAFSSSVVFAVISCCRASFELFVLLQISILNLLITKLVELEGYHSPVGLPSFVANV